MKKLIPFIPLIPILGFFYIFIVMPEWKEGGLHGGWKFAMWSGIIHGLGFFPMLMLIVTWKN